VKVVVLIFSDLAKKLAIINIFIVKVVVLIFSDLAKKMDAEPFE
jgi:hypothetical protein